MTLSDNTNGKKPYGEISGGGSNLKRESNSF